MKSPLLAPELQEIIEKNDDKALQAFCASLHPASVAAFLGALSGQEISPGDILMALWKELKVGLSIALLLAGLAFGRVVSFAGGSNRPEGYSIPTIGLAVSAALGLQVLTSTLIGALLPLAAARLKFGNEDDCIISKRSSRVEFYRGNNSVVW